MSVRTASTCPNPAGGVLNGYGAPIAQAFDQTALTGSGNIVIPVAPGITKGLARVSISTVNPATTLALGAVSATDGTNTVQVGSTARLAATAAGTKLDLQFEFVLSITATSLTFPWTLGGGTTTATVNTEIYGNP